MTLRIAHAIRSLAPDAGGPPVVCRLLAGAQAAAGHAVAVFAESDGGGAGLPVRLLGRTPARERWTRGPVGRAAGAALVEIDVLHLHGVWDAFLHAAAAAARAAGVPYVVMPHGMIDPWSMAQKPWKKQLALALGTRRMMNCAAALHLLYREEGDFARGLGVTARGEVIPNGVMLAEIDPPPPASEFRDSVPGLGIRPYVLFLGRLHHKKGLDYLADAAALLAARFPDVRYVVAGPDGGARTEFLARVLRLGLRNSFYDVGTVYGRRKWAAIAGAACFCLPSRQEGFSVAVLEAMACRVPVVISDQCHFPEVVGAGAGVVAALTAEAVAAGLAAVLSDPAAAEEMGRAGRALVERHYTWDRIAAGTVDLYRECLAGRRT